MSSLLSIMTLSFLAALPTQADGPGMTCPGNPAISEENYHSSLWDGLEVLLARFDTLNNASPDGWGYQHSPSDAAYDKAQGEVFDILDK